MAVMTPDQMDELVNTTLSLFKRMSWTDLSMEFTEYLSSRILKEKFVVERGGPDVRFKVKTRNTGLARNTGILSEDVTGIEDTTIEAVVPWTKQTVNWSYSVDEEEFQSDRETIIDILRLRNHDAMSDMVKLNEENMWSEPTSSSDKRPMGIPFWLQKDTNTAANDGTMNGRNPAGFSGGAAGISSVEYARWRNWTFRYAQPTPDDLVRKIKLALHRTKFKSPVPHPELKYGNMPQREVYTTYRVSEPLERLAEVRNENHRNELATFMFGYGDGIVIGKIPIIPVDILDSDTNDPLYGVDWSTMRPFVRKGANMRKMGPIQMPKQHDGKSVHYDTFMNYCCYNRRRNWVGSLATS